MTAEQIELISTYQEQVVVRMGFSVARVSQVDGW
jgi:hypothetical protein